MNKIERELLANKVAQKANAARRAELRKELRELKSEAWRLKVGRNILHSRQWRPVFRRMLRQLDASAVPVRDQTHPADSLKWMVTVGDPAQFVIFSGLRGDPLRPGDTLSIGGDVSARHPCGTLFLNGIPLCTKLVEILLRAGKITGTEAMTLAS
jgi:hypothetical protein